MATDKGKKKVKNSGKPNKNHQNMSLNNKNVYYKFNFKFLELYNKTDKKYTDIAYKNLFNKVLMLSEEKIASIQGKGKNNAIEMIKLDSFTSTEKIQNKLKRIEDTNSIYRNSISVDTKKKVSVFRISPINNCPSRVICYEKSGILFLLYLDVFGKAYNHGS